MTRQPTRTPPDRRAARIWGAAGAAALLAALVGGLPVALVRLAGNPLPAGVPTLDGILAALTSPDDGTLLLAVLSALGWLGWAGFTGSVVVEVGARLVRRRTPRIPGLAGPQRLASALVAAVAAISVSPVLASSDAAFVTGPPPVSAAQLAPPPGDHPPPSGAPATGMVVHEVVRGEGLLDLQERYGVPWRRIAAANYGLTQPDGGALQPGQTRVYPGWRLRIPGSAASEAGQAAPGTGQAAGAGQAASGTGQPTPRPELAYEVVEGDWMWYIAQRYLGDPTRYPDIAALNPGYAQQHGDYPDHIEPGWVLALPPEATDRGPVPHAAGDAATALPADTAPDSTAPPPDTTTTPPADTTAPPPDTTTTPPADTTAPPPDTTTAPPADTAAPPPDTTTAPPDRATPDDGPPSGADDLDELAAEEDDPERLVPAALGGAGLLAALVLAITAGYRLRRRARLSSATAPVSSAARLERVVRTAQQPLDVERLDAAVRALAAGLATGGHQLPDAAGVLVTAGAVELLLTSPCPDPPPPWLDRGHRWVLPANTPLPGAVGTLAPMPALVAVGSQAGSHLLLDLERIGPLWVYGDPDRGEDLLRYMAAELACNSWSDTVEVLLIGFEPDDARRLAELGPARVRTPGTAAEAIALLRQRADAARAALSYTGAPGPLAGRVHGLAGDAWMPRVLLVRGPVSPELASVMDELAAAGRCAAAVAALGQDPPPDGEGLVAVTPDGVLHVRMPYLRTSLGAAGLTRPELSTLAASVRAARTGEPAGPETAWSPPPATGVAGADGLAWPPACAPATPAPTSPAPASATPAPAPAGPPPTSPPPATLAPVASASTGSRYEDPDLDVDVSAWYADEPGRPRVGVLGPVRVDADGVPPDSRRLLHAELIVYLAQQGPSGADAATLATALWPDGGVGDRTRDLLLVRARQWLGTDPGGNPWLADVGPDLCYRLAEGCLFDWHLFRRLRARGEARDDAGGTADLRAAMRLVRGAPLQGATRPAAPGRRNPYPWLAGSSIDPDDLVAAAVDTAHLLAERCLAAGDTAGVRWAVQQAWLADPDRSYDQPWRDLMAAAHADGDTAQLRSLLADLMEVRDAETPADLAPGTYDLVRRWSPALSG